MLAAANPHKHRAVILYHSLTLPPLVILQDRRSLCHGRRMPTACQEYEAPHANCLILFFASYCASFESSILTIALHSRCVKSLYFGLTRSTGRNSTPSASNSCRNRRIDRL